MSETKYNILDYNAHINNTSFNEVLRDIEARKLDVSNCSLSDYQLKTLLSLTFVYGTYYDKIDNKERELFLKAVFDEKIPALDLPKRFCLHLLNNLEIESNQEFHNLAELKFDLISPIKNGAVLDFVETDLIDVVESHRKWEFGRFVAENMFNNPVLMKLRSEIETNPQKRDKFQEKLEDQLTNTKSQLKPYESTFLKLLFKTKLNPKSASIAEYLMIANIFQEKVFRLSLSTKKYVDILNTAISKTNSKQKGKGEQRL